MAFLLMFSLQCLFPLFDYSRADEFLGLSIVNRDSQPREFTITAMSPEGTNAQTGRVSIPAGGQRAQLVNEILGTPRRPESGWMRIDSPATGCTSYLASGNDGMMDSIEATTITGTTIFIPNVSIFTGFVELNYIDTYVAIVNSGGIPATVTARLFRLDGVMTGSTDISVPASGSRTLTLSEAFRDVLPDNRLGGRVFEGYLRLDANVPIAAWERIETALSRKLARGRSLEEIRPTALALVPHFAIGAEYESILNLVNPTGGSLNLELTAVDDRGNVIGETARLTLAAGQVQRSSVGALFRIVSASPAAVTSGHIRIREPQEGSIQVVGDVEIFTRAFDSMSASVLYPISDTAAADWTIPFVSNSKDYFSGYAIANPNEMLTVQTEVQVEILNSAGTVVQTSTISLSPRSRQASVVTADVPSGYVRFTSNLPIHVVGAIGTRTGRLLDQLPALR
jgi:hypothetical protein